MMMCLFLRQITVSLLIAQSSPNADAWLRAFLDTTAVEMKIERKMTRKEADHLALNPTTTMRQAIKPMIDEMIRNTDVSSESIKEMKRKTNKIRPAS